MLSSEHYLAKERDATELMNSMGSMQRSGQDREEIVSNRLATAESQVVECRERILSLGYEKKSLEEALTKAKTTCSAHERKEISDSCLGTTAEHESQLLQLERDCLSKAEEEVSKERAQWIASEAQLNEQLQEHVESEKQLRESREDLRRTMMEKIHQLEQGNDDKDGEIKKCKEVIAGLEAHQLAWEQSLTEQKATWDASKAEEIGRLNDEIANLQNAGMANEVKVQELETSIRQGLLERKR